ncbi:cyclohexanecarboxylate-CoA ligase [Mycolicibacterium sp. BK556]|uniref:AMP-binding protein n=1 Tax=unclassified Mycolicibacterium TaxID=2636767 RepID=UPI0016175D3F|nr:MULTISPECIES: AMP-binding protein [unclassified Mycolicibacterium]MBB3600390.1 cyclohexanecarboxylate-CoA ligase [Mycolicibacterium sp. BK556]MBB3630142.1 cyclohexanecarboxylate-CoA ligase [Mycolicibacterium sp. BK607]MBB3748140.1 cyclohexanecarboxylate-CoA ligase [Mycolicibacterium sp. BK634]
MLLATRRSDVDYLAAGYWEERTVSSFLDRAASSAPDQIAVRTGGGDITYRQLRDDVNAVAAGLTMRGVHRHDVVTVMLPNWHEAVPAIHGATWAGCVVNPVVTTYRRAELSFILDQSDSRAVVIPHVFRGFDYVKMLSEVTSTMARPPLVVVVRPQGSLPAGFIGFDELAAGAGPVNAVGDPADICLLLYTSGTTSQPKGVLHSHQTVLWEMRSIIREFTLGHDDRFFMASPVGHLTGIVYGIYLPTLLRQSVSLLDVWDASAAAGIIERDHCRVSLGATPFLHGLVDEYRRRGTGSSLKLFLCGGADVPPDLVAQGTHVLDALVTRTYGSSEMPTYSVSGPHATLELCSTTDGTPLSPSSGHLINEKDGVGELVVQGPELFLGYLDAGLNASAFTDDGYFRTGDLASVSDSGAITVRGRLKDIVIRGGENISTLEVENHLRQHPDICDVAVIGYPDDRMGERVAAILVLSEGVSPDNIAAVDFLKARGLAAHKCPERIVAVAELPYTASGKVHKQLLRQQMSGGLV